MFLKQKRRKCLDKIVYVPKAICSILFCSGWRMFTDTDDLLYQDLFPIKTLIEGPKIIEAQTNNIKLGSLILLCRRMAPIGRVGFFLP